MDKSKLRHIGIFVSDLNAMSAFYQKLFDMKVIYTQIEGGEYLSNLTDILNAEFEIIKLKSNDGLVIELLRNYTGLDPDREQRQLCDKGFSHLAITVRDIGETRSRLSTAGATFISEPLSSPIASVKVCFCRDPEGNFLELVQDI